jgi:nicotinamide-nucleotide amidase
MDLEVVTVGTELLLGFTIDSNTADIARAVTSVGGRVVRRVSVADDRRQIRDAVAGGLRRSGFVVVTGGLGPTRDDVTKLAVAALFDAPLELDQAYLEELEGRFAAFRRGPIPPSNRSQAEIPRGATILRNPSGTAPGLLLNGSLGTAVLLPGVPQEMRRMVQEHLVPIVREQATRDGEPAVAIHSRTLRTTGITESGLATALDAVVDGTSDVSVAYLPGFDGVDLRLTAWHMMAGEAHAALNAATERLMPVLGSRYYGEGETDLAGVVLEALRNRQERLAVAESCTGGLLGARLAAVPGASDVFAGGVIAYADAVKLELLDVPAAVIDRHGAVSEEVALAMVRGAAGRLGADAAIAVTGVAGPSGGSDEKPVGTVWLAARLADRERAVLRRFPGRRGEVRHRAAQAGLDLLRVLIDE